MPRPVFAVRNREREILDEGELAPAEMRLVRRDLHVVNRWLGGYRATIAGIERLLPPGCRALRVLDAGAGAGDLATALQVWARGRGLALEVLSLDPSAEAALLARARLGDGPGVSRVLRASVLALPLARDAVDIAVASLLFHHLDEASAAQALGEMHRVSRLGVVVNDLHRHPVAYRAIRLLTRVLPASATVRHDAPLSVLRAFRRGELRALAHAAGLRAEVRWRWAFRWLLVVRKEGREGTGEAG